MQIDKAAAEARLARARGASLDEILEVQGGVGSNSAVPMVSKVHKGIRPCGALRCLTPTGLDPQSDP